MNCFNVYVLFIFILTIIFVGTDPINLILPLFIFVLQLIKVPLHLRINYVSKNITFIIN